jgi:hypothetical protein
MYPNSNLWIIAYRCNMIEGNLCCIILKIERVFKHHIYNICCKERYATLSSGSPVLIPRPIFELITYRF